MKIPNRRTDASFPSRRTFMRTLGAASLVTANRARALGASGNKFLRAGISDTCITPPTGTRLLEPYFQESTGKLDDLYARVLVLGDHDTLVAIVCLDLVGLDFGFADHLRTAVQKLGVTAALFNCSHTHNAPVSVPYKLIGWQYHLEHDGAWRSNVLQLVVAAVQRALASMQDVTLSAHRASVTIGYSRRPEPSTVVPWTDVLRVNQSDGRPLTILFSHAAHPVVVHNTDSRFTADYPGYAVQTVEKAVGDGTHAMFAQACGGNILAPLRKGIEQAREVGTRLGTVVAQASLDGETIRSTKLRVRTQRLDLPLQHWPALEGIEERLRRHKEEWLQDQNNPETQALYQCSTDQLQRARANEKGSLRFEITTLSLGADWCLLAMSHELLAHYQFQIEGLSPFHRTMVLGYTNGLESYIPSAFDLRTATESDYEAAPFTGAALCFPQRRAIAPSSEQLILDAAEAGLRL
jgi:hypothetical protein